MSHQEWINDLSEKDRLTLLARHPRAIIHIKKPSFNEVALIVDTDVDMFMPNTEMDLESQLYFIAKYPDMIHVIKDPMAPVLDIAIESHPFAITRVENFTDEQLIRAITLEPTVMDYPFLGDRRKRIESYIETYATLMK